MRALQSMIHHRLPSPNSFLRNKNVISLSMKTTLIKYARVLRWIEHEIGRIAIIWSERERKVVHKIYRINKKRVKYHILFSW